MKILVACERSGIVRRAFADAGHDVTSVDFAPADDGSKDHWQGSVELYWAAVGQYEKWDMLIAHPPCTRLCNSGVRWLRERNLWDELDKAADFFNWLNGLPIPRKAIENPIPHKYARERIGKYDQLIQPWNFGHAETKAICLWLTGLMPLQVWYKLKPLNVKPKVHHMPPGPERARLRSNFYPKIAKAMAEQWRT